MGQYHFQNNSAQPEVVSAPIVPEGDPIVHWEASEFVDHQKSTGWFLVLGLGALIGCVLIYFITRSILSTTVAVLAVLAFGMIARQKPRTLVYALYGKSIKIGEKSYSYNDFRSFSVSNEGGLPSVSLQPIKRFMPILTIFFPPEDGEKIFDTLASRMPHEQRKDDAVERLMRKIRF